MKLNNKSWKNTDALKEEFYKAIQKEEFHKTIQNIHYDLKKSMHREKVKNVNNKP